MIVFDAASNSGFGGARSSFSWLHTTSGTNRLLYVGVTTVDDSVTGVTYNGVAMTLIDSQAASTGDSKVTTFYLVNPTSGSNTVEVTLGGSEIANGSYAAAVSLTGVDQTSPLDASNKAQAATVDVTVVAAQSWVIDTFARLASTVVTVGAGQTERWNAASDLGLRVAGSTEPNVSAGAVTMNWTGGSYAPCIVAASFKPAPPVIGNPIGLLLVLTYSEVVAAAGTYPGWYGSGGYF